jgi:hypothetical protein
MRYSQEILRDIPPAEYFEICSKELRNKVIEDHLSRSSGDAIAIWIELALHEDYVREYRSGHAIQNEHFLSSIDFQTNSGEIKKCCALELAALNKNLEFLKIILNAGLPAANTGKQEFLKIVPLLLQKQADIALLAPLITYLKSKISNLSSYTIVLACFERDFLKTLESRCEEISKPRPQTLPPQVPALPQPLMHSASWRGDRSAVAPQTARNPEDTGSITDPLIKKGP